MIVFRKANLHDAEELAKIRCQLLKEIADTSKTKLSQKELNDLKEANKSYFNSALKDDSFAAWLALHGDKIIATSGLSFSVVPPYPKCLDGKAAYIMNMYTLKDYQKQGIGTELLKRIVEEAKIRGYKKITLNATETGRKLYEKFGFKEVNNGMVFYIE